MDGRIRQNSRTQIFVDLSKKTGNVQKLIPAKINFLNVVKKTLITVSEISTNPLASVVSREDTLSVLKKLGLSSEIL